MERGQRTESQREPVYWGQKLPTHFSLMLHFHAVEVQPSIHLHPFSPENRGNVTGEAEWGKEC